MTQLIWPEMDLLRVAWVLMHAQGAMYRLHQQYITYSSLHLRFRHHAATNTVNRPASGIDEEHEHAGAGHSQALLLDMSTAIFSQVYRLHLPHTMWLRVPAMKDSTEPLLGWLASSRHLRDEGLMVYSLILFMIFVFI